MTPSSYQPFLIGEGTTKTGLFQYLQSWVAPEDAFDKLEDAYINRGVINKRDGQSLLGVMEYCSDELIAYGNGGTNYAGTMSTHLPIMAGSVSIQTFLTSNKVETYSDNSLGTLTGNQGGTGTIVYATGVWSITSAVNVKSGSPIMMDYAFVPTTATNPHLNSSVVAIATNVGAFAGTFPFNLPIAPGSAFMTFDVTGTGSTTYLDDGAGHFRVSLPAGAQVGTINYSTGAWAITIPAAGTAVNGSPIVLGLSMANATFTIMGINQWNDEVNNTFVLTVEDTRRMSFYTVATNAFQPVCDVAETLFIIPGTPTSPLNNFLTGTSVVPTFGLIAPLSIVLTLVDPTVAPNPIIVTTTDDGSGNIVANGAFTGGTINYLTGAFSININTGAVTTGQAINVTFTLQNDYFTGNQSNFFNWTNWDQPTNLIVSQVKNNEEPAQYHNGFLYLTNNVDPVTLYDGISNTLSRPAFAIKQVNLGDGFNEILTTLDVKVFDNRLLFVRPTTTIDDGNPEPQTIRYSAQFNPTNFVADIPGSGGFVVFSGSDWINSAKFLKDFLIVMLQNSTYSMRTTGNAFAPFLAYKINSTKNISAPYGSIEFDDVIKAMGTKGLIYCDGNDVDRYDFKIFDQFENISSQNFIQCFGQRFDILNQAWMLYPDISTQATLSNKVLLHNYVEDSWAVFNMPLSCLGIGFGVKDFTWADFAPGGLANPDGTLVWGNADFPWNNSLVQSESLRLLGGDYNGRILQLNDGPTDNGIPIIMNAITKKYNPFAKDGALGQFGYIDVYYTVNPLVELTFSFFIDNSSTIEGVNPSFQRNMHLTGKNANSAYGWQRLFINVQAEQIQWQIQDNGFSGFQILGQILWAVQQAG